MSRKDYQLIAEKAIREKEESLKAKI